MEEDTGGEVRTGGEDREREDGQEEPKDKDTANILCGLANTIAPGMIKMEVDYPSNHHNGRLPILDLEVWVDEDNKVLHQFYKKSMATTMVVLARSALPASAKRSILVAEGLRRLLNCHPDLPNTMKAGFLTEFNLRMKECGHEHHFRQVVTKRAVEKYVNSLALLQSGAKQMYRSKVEKVAQGLAADSQTKKSKTGWYKELGYDGVVTVPATVGSGLMKEVEKALKATDAPRGYKMMVAEDGGRTLASDLTRSNPFPQANCGRAKCGMCATGDGKGQCWRSNVVYSIRCSRCPDKDGHGVAMPVFEYIGETSRTIYTRGLEHQALYLAGKDQSFMWRHTMEVHGGVITSAVEDYTYKVLSSHRESLNRVLEEAVNIQASTNNPRTVSLNSRMEYFAPQYVRPTFHKGPAM